MEEEKQGLWHFSENSVQKSVKEPPGSRYGQKINGGSGSSTKNAVQSTMIEKEKKQLEKLKAKQVLIFI